MYIYSISWPPLALKLKEAMAIYIYFYLQLHLNLYMCTYIRACVIHTYTYIYNTGRNIRRTLYYVAITLHCSGITIRVHTVILHNILFYFNTIFYICITHALPNIYIVK